MTRYDSIVSAQAWNRLVRDLTDERDDPDRLEGLNDHEIAEIVRGVVYEVEGEDL